MSDQDHTTEKQSACWPNALERAVGTQNSPAPPGVVSGTIKGKAREGTNP
ncbi:hypothetical protein [Geoalkalibacter halelectricus]|uniref:Uncharacterized protein n=1 Tax=Geoalkalibacter halelectricus TaxID=2847045 RepID=A0ABY5ZQD2_9BACT|nr:hypothetical protein [Geoalkalibacter halelectricus]MDO3377426.1 hypothetical protein [Geoalkalibacter halelectricus]UWZ80813.1 hypothetical protein L9S41_05270 [Geoalkalibacter halelectricus]